MNLFQNIFKFTVFIFVFIFSFSFSNIILAQEEPEYSNTISDASQNVGNSLSSFVQTLGKNLSGTLNKIDVASSNGSFDFYASRPFFSLYECDDATYGGFISNGSVSCPIVYGGTSDDRSQISLSIQSFYPDSIVLNPLKYYAFSTGGNNGFFALATSYGSSEDVVEGSCYRVNPFSGVFPPCTGMADLYFRLYGVSKMDLPPPCTTDCFSNVIFLPGIKASVLEAAGGDTLWPPTIFSVNDVDQLALTETGESLNDIHTKGILNEFYSTDIYAPFSDFMDDLVVQEVINEWLPLAYDWRFSPEKILEDGIKTETETINVIEKMEALAANSKSGKVSIVAHSMGGILGKAIIKKLQLEGKDNLIDSFVMVGVPQIGTPQAVASILHGDSEGILAGFIANPIGIRRIAQNMPSAYNLLPSRRYFTEVADPVITFNTNSSFTQAWRSFWGDTINNYFEFSSFAIGTGVERTKPDAQKLEDPEVLRAELFANAESFHDEYDSYEFPEHVRVVQLAGWGRPTTKSVEYKTYHGYPGYVTNFTVEGDGTVVYPSAVSSGADETYYFDVEEYRKNTNKSSLHRNLLSADTVQDLAESVMRHEDVVLNNFILVTKPSVTDSDSQLIISTHSPVILGAYDQFGNFTGVDQDQDSSADILTVSENIPGSTFSYTAGSQYIFLPKNGTYNFVYKGVGVGPTTVTIDNFSNDITTPIVSFTDIPTNTSTEATFIVQTTSPQNTEINLDLNGSGQNTIIKADGAELSLSELITLIKQKIATLSTTDKLKKDLLRQIANLEKKISVNKPNIQQALLKDLSNLSKSIIKKSGKGKIPDADVQTLIDILSKIAAVI